MDDDSTLKDARARYFEDNHFGEDGGYGDAWVDFHIGPIPAPFPNTDARRRAVRYHGLHHVLTGYRTDIRGEAEISAWELGSGCRSEKAAWFLNLGGFWLGLVIAPRRAWRAHSRGLRTKNLYGRPWGEPLVARTVGATRRELGLDDAGPGAEEAAGDLAAFVGTALLASAVAVSSLPLFLLFIPVGLVSSVARRRAMGASDHPLTRANSARNAASASTDASGTAL